jgi:hypothetical protein
VLKVYIGRPMKLVSSEASFHMKWARRRWRGLYRGEGRQQKIEAEEKKYPFIFLKWKMFLVAQVIPKENTSLQTIISSCAIFRARYLFQITQLGLFLMA